MNGIVNVFKPQDFTSHDCIAILRGVTGIKKIGHTGTLDPMATGVLPCCIGKATRIIEYLDNDVKEYECTMKLGYVSDTMDIWGNVTPWGQTNPERGQTPTGVPNSERVASVLKSFEGDIQQIPPKYSAIKVNGRKLYEYARSGQQVEIKPRDVHIHSIDILSIDGDTVSFRMRCGKGTYVRSVCHDAGQLLGTGAVMTQLCRTANGLFRAEDAVDIRELKTASREFVEGLIRPIDEPLTFKKISVSEKAARDLSDGKIVDCTKLSDYKIADLTVSCEEAGSFDTSDSFENNGNVSECREVERELVSVYSGDLFVGVCRYTDGQLKADKIFNILKTI